MAPEAAEPLTPEARAAAVKACAIALGFAAAGITNTAPTPHQDALRRWLNGGLAGTMRYLHRQARRRENPERIMDGAKSVVVVLYNYAHLDPPAPGNGGKIAKYARGAD